MRAKLRRLSSVTASSLAALLALSSCSWDDLAPDQLFTSYGLGLQESGSFNAWDPVHLDTGDFELITVGLAWDIGPRLVELAEPLPVPVYVQQPSLVRSVEVAMTDEEMLDRLGDAVETFSTLDLATRVMLVVVLLWITFIYRAQLGKLIPKFGNGNNKGP